jgi:hypothetical protein
MNSQEKPESKPLDKVYQEASQWVRLVNTIIWSMGTLLVPISFGFVGLALNTSSGAQFTVRGKIILAVGSVFLFSFWVYASRIYKQSTNIAREVLIKIEKKWKVDTEMSLYKLQQPILDRRFRLFSFEIPYGLFPLQRVTLGALVLVWILILALGL